MEFKAPSGAKVVINHADFQDAMSLKNSITSEIAKNGLKLDWEKILTSRNISNDDINEFIKFVMTMDSSSAVYDAVFKCLIRCTYSGEKITENTFEDVKARQDYYEIVFNCIKENTSPFLGGLRSRLSTISELAKKVKSEDQK